MQGAATFVTMNNLLKKAAQSGVIDEVIRQAARAIANEADTVLHEKPADLSKAYDVLLMLRGVLQHIYAA
jgi:hypothetical protein